METPVLQPTSIETPVSFPLTGLSVDNHTMIPSLPLDLSHSLGHYNTGVMMASQGYRTEVMAGSVNPLTEPFPFIFPPSGQMAVSAVGLNQTTAPPTNGGVWKKSPPRQQNKYPRYTSLAEKRPSHRSHDTYRPYGRSGSGYEEDRSRNMQFTALTKSPKEILATEEARFNFRPPKPMPKNTERQSNKFCDFHGDVGHHTNDCFQLKKRIEAAVKSGELAHLVKDIKEKKGKEGIKRNGWPEK
ncbi:hypothetical protein E3N88_01376 [Mikania micrantha]|uniref:Reverse transcriptase domain-containing protein n=1 Tax=Mikania micrantha TaxID=192012 RepID=A0A5N6Q3H7_9ASTR|nr:hypothetical protein E3N88_01376 [Mikania micrantha]